MVKEFYADQLKIRTLPAAGNRSLEHRFDRRRFSLSPPGQIELINVLVEKAKPKRRQKRESGAA